MSAARKLALRLKRPRQAQHRVLGCLLWSQNSAQGQAQWVTQQTEIPLSCMSSLAALLSISSLLPQSTHPTATLFVLQKDKSHLCAKTLLQRSQISPVLQAQRTWALTLLQGLGAPQLERVCMPRRLWVTAQQQ